MKLVKVLFAQLFLLGFLLSGFSISWASENFELDELPHVDIIDTVDFRIDSRLAVKKQTPILILFSMEGCTYCQYVEEEHLKPMLRNADYGKKVIIRRVMTDDYDSLIDFDGKSVSGLDFSSRYGAYLTPTVVFLDHNGQQLSRIFGVRNTEYYGGDLDDSLDLSLQIIRKKLASLK